MDRVIAQKGLSKKRIMLIVGIIALVALILASWYFTSGNSKLNVNTDRITITEIKQGTFQEFIPVNGVVLPQTTIYLDALEGGRIEEKRTSYVAENTRIQLRQAIEQAYINMTAAYDRYQAVADQVEAYKESFRAAEIRFNLGALNSIEYLIVKNNLDRSDINLTIARYEYLLRTKVLDFYQGKLK